MEIEITLQEFLKRFPFFRDKELTQEDLENQRELVNVFIATRLNTINLTPRLQTTGVYLAFAHLMALQFDPNGSNPDGLKDARGDILSTTQGSESVGFNRGQNNWNDIFLSKTGYGLMLLSILKNINPPCIKKPLNLFPYYNSITFN